MWWGTQNFQSSLSWNPPTHCAYVHKTSRGIYSMLSLERVAPLEKFGEVKMPQNSNFRGKKLIYMLLFVFFA